MVILGGWLFLMSEVLLYPLRSEMVGHSAPRRACLDGNQKERIMKKNQKERIMSKKSEKGPPRDRKKGPPQESTGSVANARLGTESYFT